MLRRYRARPIPPRVIMLVVFLLLVGIGFAIYRSMNDTKVTDFDSCVAAGNPTLMTNPPQCSHRGQSYFRPGEAPPRPF